MHWVSELYGRHPGADIYVVGTGASLRVFPASFFEGKITIGLNMAWKMVPVTYGITIHPDLNIPEFMPEETPRPEEITWIVGAAKSKALLSPEHYEHARRTHYFFEYDGRPNTAPPHEPSTAGRVVDWVRRPTGNRLYVWSSISQTGVNLAANLGARNVILVGCDNCALEANHHAHRQHTRWKGVAPEHRYRQYYEGLAETRAALRERGVNLLSLNPFLALDAPAADFLRLCDEQKAPRHLENADISRAMPPPEFLTPARRAMGRLLTRLRPGG